MIRANSITEGFRQHLAKHGLHFDNGKELIPDGEIHRVHVQSDKPGTKNGWYVLYGDPPAGRAGSWKTEQDIKWSGGNGALLSESERKKISKKVEAEKKKRQEEQQQRQAEAAKKARYIWYNARAADPEHPYLQNKNVQPHGLRQKDKALIVPGYNADDEIITLQFIQPDGTKKFLAKSKTKGAFYLIGNPESEHILYIAEGTATAFTIHEMTEHSVAIAFNTRNLKEVATALKDKYPESRFIVACDNDTTTEENPGLTKGKEAAAAINADYVYPVFSTDSGSDFNDLHNSEGQESVKNCLDNVITDEDLTSELNYYTGEDEKGNPKSYPRPYHEVLERLKTLTSGRVKSFNGELFATPDKPGDPVQWLKTPDVFFSWLGAYQQSTIDIKRNLQGAMNRGEMLAGMQATAEKVYGLETAPEFPARAEMFYNHAPLPESDFEALQNLIAFFCPETNADRFFILAFFLTAFWGSPPGQHPVFDIHALCGRGAGKTTIPKAAARLLNQSPITASTKDEPGALKKRILSPQAISKRIVNFDNETGRVKSAELAELITAGVISGHRMYQGEGERVNNLLFVITLNTQAGDSDIAHRSVTIRLAKPKYDPTWEERLWKHIDENRLALWSAIREIFNSEPTEVQARTRWALWEREILGRLPGADIEEMQRVILERQGEMDDEAEEASMILDGTKAEIRTAGHDPDTAKIFIRNGDMADIVNTTLKSKMGVVSACKTVKTLIQNELITNMETSRHGKFGRGFWFYGEHYSAVYGDGELLERTPNF